MQCLWGCGSRLCISLQYVTQLGINNEYMIKLNIRLIESWPTHIISDTNDIERLNKILDYKLLQAL